MSTTSISSSIGNTELLNRYGSMKFNDFRTIQQVWDRLNSTPYHHSKAPQYSMLRQMMLKEYDRKEAA